MVDVTERHGAQIVLDESHFRYGARSACFASTLLPHDGAHIASLVHTTLPRPARSVAAIHTSAFVLPLPRAGDLPLRICVHAALSDHGLDRLLDASGLPRTEPTGADPAHVAE
ncbi:MAG TPA: hypothetical protein VIU15_30005 [Streptomyces sp.]